MYLHKEGIAKHIQSSRNRKAVEDNNLVGLKDALFTSTLCIYVCVYGGSGEAEFCKLSTI